MVPSTLIETTLTPPTLIQYVCMSACSVIMGLITGLTTGLDLGSSTTTRQADRQPGSQAARRPDNSLQADPTAGASVRRNAADIGTL